MAGPCDDLRVIDLSSGPAGGIATMVLADFGADVIKVERPGGDPFRRLAAAPMWLRGKRSVEVDLASDEGRTRLDALAAGADVLVSSFGPEQASGLGLDLEALRAAHPALVTCSITGWGPRGPYAGYPGYEALVAAKCGRMRHLEGIAPREGPAYAAVQTATHATAQSAVAGILAALLVRDATGEGQAVETSLLQALLPYDLRILVWRQLAERYPERFAGNAFSAPPPAPTLQYQPVLTKDGRWIQLANLLEHHFATYIGVSGLGEIWAEERFLGAPRGIDDAAKEALRERMLARMQEQTAEEWMDLYRENGNVAAEPFGMALDGLQQPDMLANGEIVTIEDPALGPVRQLGPIARLTATPAFVTRAAPAVGQHTAEVLAEPPREVSVAGGGARPEYPLAGVTVVEFATIIAAPLGGSLLADLGARVIKVEPIGGDPYRGLGEGFGVYIPTSKTTAGKESICLDLKSEAGGEIARQLVAKADVLIHNYRPGVPERLGIGWEQARELNPRLVHVAAMGYGPDGPGASRPSAHPLPGALLGGALHQAGAGVPPAEYASLDEIRETGRRLFRANEANPDPNTSMAIFSAALLGLYARRRTGEGQQVFVSMLGANAYANFDDFLDYEGKPPRTPVDGELYGLHALYRLYPARRGWVFLAAPTEEAWQRLARVVDAELGGSNPSDAGELATDARFADAASRRAHDAELASRLEAVFADRDAAAWERLLIAEGVGCVEAGAEDFADFFLGEHAQANGFAPETEHVMWGPYRRWGATVTLPATPGPARPGVLAGEHTDAILAELGLDEAAIANLRSEGVVASEPTVYEG